MKQQQQQRRKKKKKGVDMYMNVFGMVRINKRQYTICHSQSDALRTVIDHYAGMICRQIANIRSGRRRQQT